MAGTIPAPCALLRKQSVGLLSIILILAGLQIQSAHGSGDDPASYPRAIWDSSTVRDRDFKIRRASWGDRSGRKITVNSDNLQVHVPSLRRVLATNNRSQEDSEVETLIAFRAAITTDPLGALTSWHANDSKPCGWAGIVCSSDTRQNVVAVNLRGRQLVGKIDSALLMFGQLKFLERLDLSNNSFSGSISATALAKYDTLSYLNVSSNQMSGSIPVEIGNLLKLKVLDFHTNNLTGGIPVSVGNCTSLQVIDLGTNFLEGNIPSALGRLSALQTLDLGNIVAPLILQGGSPSSANAFSGSIPTSLGNCSSLTYLNLNYNANLEGDLPLELSQLENLEELHLRYNKFSGVFPAWVGNLTKLTVLEVNENQFYGRIPETVGQLRGLQYFKIGENTFSGAIPTIITNCTSLITLGLEVNSLVGDIPQELGLLKSLEKLYLWGNSFTGVIPASISNCSSLSLLEVGNFSDDVIPPSMSPQPFPTWVVTLTNLSYLKLPAVNLQGQIPPDIGALSNLQELYLGMNNLTGPIPYSLANCTSLSDMELSFNQLTGGIPSDIGVMENLAILAIDNNRLSGPFPSSLTNLSQIEELRLSSNLFRGTTDSNLGRLSLLQRLELADNQFEGPIPENLSNCSALWRMILSGNNLSGEIGAVLANLTQLEYLDISRNKIGGRIPTEFKALTKLSHLQLDFNNLEGEIFFDIGRLSLLENLSLNHNRFSGSVPKSLSNCSGLIGLDLSYNQFSGEVPGEAISKLKILTSVNLSHNHFSGSWPQQFVGLENIRSIDISANNISGPVILVQSGGDPIWTDLSRLDISMNSFSGAIPESLGKLPALSFFNASFNNFEGPLPDSGIFESNLTEASFLGNPGLCGVIFGSDRGCQSSSADARCKAFTCKHVWIPVTVVGFSIALIITAVLVLWWTRPLPFKNGHKKSSEVVMLNWSSTRFSTADVSAAISRNGSSVIGGGAGSVVYKGILPGGELIAVKTLERGGERMAGLDDRLERQLLQEVHTMAQLRHRNVLKVLGFCSTEDFKAIILEFMPQGSLHQHLYLPGKGVCDLPWETRFKIAIGVGEGMKYFHHDFPEPLVHCDLKPGNILLDERLDAKVADFGLSKFTRSHSEGEASASAICGTLGYMPPEYAIEANVSTKGDVFSYGIVLLELLTGKPPISGENFANGPDADYRGSILKVFQERPADSLDPTLKLEGMMDTKKREQMMYMMRVALFCTRERSQNRPSMIEVLEMLIQTKEVTLDPKTFRDVEDILNESTYPVDD